MNTNKSCHPYSRKRGISPFRRRLLCLIVIFFFSSNLAFANPNGPQVVNGTVSFTTQGNTLTVTNSPNSIINWKGFSIGISELTRFVQQSGSSAVLNRVIGQDASAILGALQSNGRVLLINPNGILFGPQSRIDVNGLIASTLNLSNQDFLAGKYNFTAGLTAGGIENQGTITTPAGGQVYLIAPDIKNTGIINTPKGEVILAAGRSVQLVDSANPFISVAVSAPADSVVNLGQIIAASGRVGIYGGLISQKGIVRADSAVVGESGQIIFKATKGITLDKDSVTTANGPEGGKITMQTETGTTLVSGTVSAAGAGGKGGEIRVLGQQVGLVDNALVDVSGKTGGGKVLVGGDYQGKNPDIQNAGATAVGENAVIRADATEVGDGGKVIVWSDGNTSVAGKISAQGGVLSGNGGFVETSGHKLSIADTAGVSTLAPKGRTGNWLLDPSDFTIAASGGDMTGTALGTALAANNVEIFSTSDGTAGNGDIFVNDNISWTKNLLTLNAYRNIEINKELFGSGTGTCSGSTNCAQLSLLYGQGNSGGIISEIPATYTINAPVNLPAGNNFSTKMGSSGALTTYTVITDLGVLSDAASGTNQTLQGMARSANLSGNYVLGANIDASATGTAVWNSSGEGFSPIGTSGSPFSGIFNGLGHKITGLTINRPTTNYIGLFGATGSSAVIGNVGLVAGNITGNSYVGGLVGRNSGTVNNTYNTGTVTGNGSSVGGLVGNLLAGTITNSYNTGTVTSSGSDIGGLVGSMTAGYISASYNAGTVTGNGNMVGGLVGDIDAGIISTSYSTGAVTGSSAVGGLVGDMDGGAVSYSYSTGAVTGTSDVGGLAGSKSGGTITYSFWDKTTSGQSTSAGAGTGAAVGHTTAELMDPDTYSHWANFAANWYMIDGYTRPFLLSEYSTAIRNAHQLQLMQTNPTANYTLANNIDMNELTKAAGMWNTTTGFVPVGNDSANFTGTFDGNSHTITGLVINTSLDNAGLFGYVNGGSVLNVGLVGGSVEGNDAVGGLVGINKCGTISNSYNTGTVTGTSDIGGLVGYNKMGTISNSYSTGSVTLTEDGSYAGGLVGSNVGGTVNSFIENSYSTGAVTGSDSGGLVGYNAKGAITNSYATGAVTGSIKLGGLVGVNTTSGTITGSYATGAVTGSINYIGGLVGINGGSITDSYATGAVTGYINIGGLAGGMSGGTITNSYNTGAVTANSGYGGGLIGFLNGGAISSSYNTGFISGAGGLGGLVGYVYDGTISSSYNTGTVTAESGGAGGLVATMRTGTITNSHNTGPVTGNGMYVGGLIGSITTDVTIDNSYNTGSITGSAYVGGLVGNMNGGTISRSYNAGTVSEASHIGGLVGYMYDGAIGNSYSTGAVTGGDYAGGLVGYLAGGTIGNSYATGAVIGGADVGGLIGHVYDGTITNSLWDTDTTKQTYMTGNLSIITGGYSTAALLAKATYSGWDFTDSTGVWYMIDGYTRPFLQSEYSTTIRNAHQLQLMNLDLSASYTLANNIDMSELTKAAGLWKTTTGFVPVGNGTANFTGTFDGASHTITGLTINLPTNDYVGLFGYMSGGYVQNVGLVDASVTGQDYVGGLVGKNYYSAYSGSSEIYNSYVTGTVTGRDNVGGLVGYKLFGVYSGSGAIADSYSAAAVTGRNYVGGLVGYNYYSSSSTGGASISNSFNTGAVTANKTGSITGNLTDKEFGNIYAGGLAGYNYYSSSSGNTAIGNSYNAGAVTASNASSVDGNIEGNSIAGNVYAGGLVGYLDAGAISNSYNMGAVTADNASSVTGNIGGSSITGNIYAGGLAGYVNAGALSFSYSTGAVTGNNTGTVNGNVGGSTVNGNIYAGGLAGHLNAGTTISHAYATGPVTGNNTSSVAGSIGGIYTGGLAGYVNPNDISNAFWDTVTTMQPNMAGNISDSTGGYTTADLMKTATYSGWDDFSSAWYMIEGYTRPFLQSEYSTTIRNAHQLQLMQTDLTAGYNLANNIDMSELTRAAGMWKPDTTANSNEGFVPVGNNVTKFTGAFDGNNHTITGLFIDRALISYVGLFGYAKDATIANVGLANVDITGYDPVGGLVGYLSNSTLDNSYVTGKITGKSTGGACTGGLVGYMAAGGTISNSYNAAAVTGELHVGGLTGYMVGGAISNSHNTGAVTGIDQVGGLAGYMAGGAISNSYNTGAVIGSSAVGGLVGYLSGGAISSSYNTGAVTGGDEVGGLVGYLSGGTISNSYNTGAVTGYYMIGGLVGDMNAGVISYAYSTGPVTLMSGEGSNAGGLIGRRTGGTITYSFWDTDTSGQANMVGDSEDNTGGDSDHNTGGYSTADLMKTATYSGWDFTDTWYMVDGYTRPFLRSEYSTTIRNAHQLQLMNLDLSAGYTLANDIGLSELKQAAGMWNTATGFVPVGDGTTNFTGTFDGQNHTITGLYVNRTTPYAGLFGYADKATIKNIGLVNADITGADPVGGLVGYLSGGRISNSYVTGTVTGTGGGECTGGLAGENYGGNISNSHNTAAITGVNNVGGLVGYMSGGAISSSYNEAGVTGGDYVGGLLGYMSSGTISDAYNTGTVTGENNVSGLVGYNVGGTISGATSTGTVTTNSSNSSSGSSSATPTASTTTTTTTTTTTESTTTTTTDTTATTGSTTESSTTTTDTNTVTTQEEQALTHAENTAVTALNDTNTTTVQQKNAQTEPTTTQQKEETTTSSDSQTTAKQADTEENKDKDNKKDKDKDSDKKSTKETKPEGTQKTKLPYCN